MVSLNRIIFHYSETGSYVYVEKSSRKDHLVIVWDYSTKRTKFILFLYLTLCLLTKKSFIGTLKMYNVYFKRNAFLNLSKRT